MRKTDINISKTRSANYLLPPVISMLESEKKSISLLKWRIAPEVQGRRNLTGRLNAAVREMEYIAKKLNDIYEVTESALLQLEKTENALNDNISKFI